jgi:pantoate--beta-alanine ligase
MQTIKTIAELRAALAPHRKAGRSVGFVPTMGYLHVGHMALIDQARKNNDIVVVSIFVNPLQFAPSEDLTRYPRDLPRDSAMLADAGVDYLFAPDVEDMYPRPMLTIVDVPDLGRLLEGSVRPGHFAGVATVVTKLFNIVMPDRAYFGEKDFQQLLVIKRMVSDLSLPVDVIACPTVREPDGLACSSRNVYLSPDERAAAAIVPKALDEAERLLSLGTTSAADLLAAIHRVIKTEPLAEAELVAICDPETLKPVEILDSTPVLVLLFVRFGRTKLLDNRIIRRQTI